MHWDQAKSDFGQTEGVQHDSKQVLFEPLNEVFATAARGASSTTTSLNRVFGTNPKISLTINILKRKISIFKLKIGLFKLKTSL